MNRSPFASLNEVKNICGQIIAHKLPKPPSLYDAIVAGMWTLIQSIYNGAGPDSMIKWGRSILTFLLRYYKAAVLVHDWRYTKINELRKTLLAMIGKPISEFDFAGVLEDWHFILENESETSIFLGNWIDGEIFSETAYNDLLRALWHDTNREFYETMKTLSTKGWEIICWPYRRVKIWLAYRATESESGWKAWLS